MKTAKIRKLILGLGMLLFFLINIFTLTTKPTYAATALEPAHWNWYPEHSMSRCDPIQPDQSWNCNKDTYELWSWTAYHHT